MEYKILDAHEAEEIAQDCGLSSEEEGAALWFNEIYYESTWRVDKMPKYNQFVKKIEGGNLYYDYGANYYFLVQENNVNESKNTIRLTESEFKQIVTESVKGILKENKQINELERYYQCFISNIENIISSLKWVHTEDYSKQHVEDIVYILKSNIMSFGRYINELNKNEN